VYGWTQKNPPKRPALFIRAFWSLVVPREFCTRNKQSPNKKKRINLGKVGYYLLSFPNDSTQTQKAKGGSESQKTALCSVLCGDREVKVILWCHQGKQKTYCKENLEGLLCGWGVHWCVKNSLEGSLKSRILL